jgi:hypothetical protein
MGAALGKPKRVPFGQFSFPIRNGCLPDSIENKFGGRLDRRQTDLFPDKIP